jgi:hypothetical protein
MAFKVDLGEELNTLCAHSEEEEQLDQRLDC